MVYDQRSKNNIFRLEQHWSLAHQHFNIKFGLTTRDLGEAMGKKDRIIGCLKCASPQLIGRTITETFELKVESERDHAYDFSKVTNERSECLQVQCGSQYRHGPAGGRDGVVEDLGRSFGDRIKAGSVVDGRDSLRNLDTDFCDHPRDGQSCQDQRPSGRSSGG